MKKRLEWEIMRGYYYRLSCSTSVMLFCLIGDSKGPPTKTCGGCRLWRRRRELSGLRRIDQYCYEMTYLIWDVYVSSRIVAYSSMTRKAIGAIRWRATCSATAVISGALILNCHHIHLQAIQCTSQNSERHFHDLYAVWKRRRKSKNDFPVPLKMRFQ